MGGLSENHLCRSADLTEADTCQPRANERRSGPGAHIFMGRSEKSHTDIRSLDGMKPPVVRLCSMLPLHEIRDSIRVDIPIRKAWNPVSIPFPRARVRGAETPPQGAKVGKRGHDAR